MFVNGPLAEAMTAMFASAAFSPSPFRPALMALITLRASMALTSLSPLVS